MAEYYRSEVKAGCFIALATSIGVAFLFWIAGSDVLRETRTYRVRFDDATGLGAKTPVRIAGKDVGTVESIGLSADNRYAEVVVEIDRGITLYADASWQIQTSSLLGTRFIALHPGTDNRQTVDSTFQFKGASGTQMGQLFASAESGLNEGTKMMSEMAKTLETFRAHEEELLTDLSTMLREFAELGETTNRLVTEREDDLALALDNVSAITAEIRLLLEENRELVGDLLENSNIQLTRVSDMAVDTMDAFRETLDVRVAALLDETNALVAELHRTMLMSTPDVQRIVANAREMTENMREFSARIAADPSLLIFGTGEQPDGEDGDTRVSEQRLRDEGRLPLADKRER